MDYYLTQQGLYLAHHGIKGQKWGQRRYQNEDGSLTPEGREHYGYGEARKAYKNKIDAANEEYRYARKETKHAITSLKKNRNTMSKDEYDEYVKELKSYPSISKKILKARKKAAKEEYKNSDEYKARQEKIKKAAIVGVAVAGTALAAYGAYKYTEATKDKAYKLSMERGHSALNQILHDADSKMFFSNDFDFSGGMSRRRTAISNAADDLGLNVHNTAQRNSSSFKKARNYLKGRGGEYSIPELERMGIRTNGSVWGGNNEDTNMVLDYYRKYRKDGSVFSNR